MEPLDLYERLVELPTPKSAVLTQESGVQIEYSTCSLLRNDRGVATSTIISQTQFETPLVPLDKEVLCTSWSPSGQRHVIFRKSKGVDSPVSIEVWSDVLEAELQGPPHKTVYAHDTYGSPSWAEDESTLVYIAGFTHPKDEDAHFGARFHSRNGFQIFALHLGLESDAKIEQVALPHSYGETYLDPQIISTSPLRLALTHWRDMSNGVQLGLDLMSNRPTAVCLWTEGQTKVEQVSSKGRSARSPRVLGDQLVYLSNPEEGTHHSGAVLHSFDLSTGKDKVLIDVVGAPTDPGGFPGIYPLALPFRPFAMVDGDPYVVFSSPWSDIHTPIAVQLSDGKVHRLTVDPTEGNPASWASQTVLCVQGDQVALSRSSLQSPPVIAIARIDNLQLVDEYATKSKLIPSAVRTLESQSSTLVPLVGHAPGLTIVQAPCPLDRLNKNNLPVVLYPHGGPHMTDATVFNPISASFVAAGFIVLRPDYPGSIGYGQDYVDVITTPDLSVMEVEASLAAFESLNESLGYSVPSERRFLYGLSHGGYIGAWIAGRYQHAVKAMVIVNPVIHMPSLIHSTDIPDLYWRSAGLPFPYNDPPSSLTPKQYADLYRLSPISLVGSAVTPTLVMLGSKDSRICPEQGKMWYHALVNKGTDAKLVSFKGENHPIDVTVDGQRRKVRVALDFLQGHVGIS